ncbi:DUF1328 domain-containing protein [Mariniblastus sp.]|nr:DUF1328 domain-containing protein [Mariniblastus sp.]
MTCLLWHGECVLLEVDHNQIPMERFMLRLAITLLLLSLVFAVFGFGGIAASFAGVAKLLFYVFIVLFAISAVVSVLGGRTPTL